MELDFMVRYHAVDLYSVTDEVSLQVRQKNIDLVSIMIIEEQGVVFMFFHMKTDCLAEVKSILETAGVLSSKLYREYNW